MKPVCLKLKDDRFVALVRRSYLELFLQGRLSCTHRIEKRWPRKQTLVFAATDWNNGRKIEEGKRWASLRRTEQFFFNIFTRISLFIIMTFMVVCTCTLASCNILQRILRYSRNLTKFHPPTTIIIIHCTYRHISKLSLLRDFILHLGNGFRIKKSCIYVLFEA